MSCSQINYVQNLQVSSFIGASSSNDVDGIGSIIKFVTPYGICFDSFDNFIVVLTADKLHKILINSLSSSSLASGEWWW